MKKVISVILVIAMVILAPFSFSGCGKNGKGKNSPVSVKLPDYNKEVDCVNTVANLAVQAQISAMLKEEKFYRLCENKAGAKELKSALEESAKEWDAADVLSSSAYLMGKRLADIEKREDYKLIKASVGLYNPFMITAHAQSAYKMEKFEDSKEWAEYINRIYDHGEVGKKTAYVAKILKTDVNRAKKAIDMANEILKGKSDLQAGYDNATYELLLKTKTAGKVAGFTAATIASAGGTMGLLGAAGYVASGVDTAIEVTDTTLTLTLGEDHQVTKSFEDSASKVAPIISVVSFANLANPEAWANGAVDAVGQYRYITDSAVDLVSSNKIFCIEVPENEGNMLKVLTIPADTDFSDKDKEELKESLIDMGFDKDAAESLLEPEKADAPQEEINKPFEELTVEELDEKAEDISLSDKEWEELFKEVYNDYLDEMQKNGGIAEDDEIWDYDPFMPFEDFPQDGDEIGFDDLSMWATPEKPFEDEESTTEPETEAEEDDVDEDEPAAEESTTAAPESVSIDDFMGTWHFTENFGGETTEVTWSMSLSGNKIIAKSSVDGDSESFSCNYTFDGSKLSISGGGFEGASFTLKNGQLVASSAGETTVMHR